MQQIRIDATTFGRLLPWVWPVIDFIPADLGQAYQARSAVYHWHGLGQMAYLLSGHGEPTWVHLN